jgi:RNA polymerase sigma factor (sigma-70 family)
VSRQTDLAEFTDFVLGCQGRVVRLAELLSGDRGRAEELAGDGFARAYAAWSRIRDSEPEAYVRRCIVAAHTDWRRGRTRRDRRRAGGPSGGGQPDQAGRPGRDSMPERDGQQERAGGGGLAPAGTVRDEVLGALARLTARERAVLVLRFYAGLSEFQAAFELGLTPGAVRSTAARALSKLEEAGLKAEASS